MPILWALRGRGGALSCPKSIDWTRRVRQSKMTQNPSHGNEKYYEKDKRLGGSTGNWTRSSRETEVGCERITVNTGWTCDHGKLEIEIQQDRRGSWELLRRGELSWDELGRSLWGCSSLGNSSADKRYLDSKWKITLGKAKFEILNSAETPRARVLGVTVTRDILHLLLRLLS